MLPTMPAGQPGAPRAPGRIGAGGTPSSASAARAQTRTVANSIRRLGTARSSTARSAGHRDSSEASQVVSTARTHGRQQALDHAGSGRIWRGHCRGWLRPCHSRG